jgi:hypothetical protein
VDRCDGAGRVRRNWLLASHVGAHLLEQCHGSLSDTEGILPGVALIACALR